MSGSSRGSGGVPVAFGALAVLANPAAVLAAHVLKGIPLLRSLYLSVPVAVLLALVAVSASRRAGFAQARSVYADAGRPGRLGRVVAWAGMYVAVIGAVALGVYGVLRASG